MPNHVQNRIRLEGSAEDVAQVIQYFTNEKGEVEIDFNKIIPTPPYVFQEGSSMLEDELYGEYNWTEWNRKYWGTKWNAYQTNDHRNTPDTLYFQTAWSGVPRLMGMVSILFPNVKVIYDYADEDSGYNTGHYAFQKGSVLRKNVHKGGSIEAYELYFDLNPGRIDDFELVDGKYQYKEDEE